MARDLYQEVTDRIVEALENGVDGTWRRPWNTARAGDVGTPYNPCGRYFYRGMNVFMLAMSAAAAGWPTVEFATYRQWAAKGAQVRKGEKGTLTVFWTKWTPADADDDDAEDGKRRGARMVLKSAHVFNAAQVDGYSPAGAPALPEFERHAACEAAIAATGAAIVHGGDRACYIPAIDEIRMPVREAFKEPAAYYATTFHELAHWTGAKARCDRNLSGRFGSDAYAAEELVAELAAAFLCGAYGIANEPRPDHAQYVASWLRVLKADKRAIFTAASAAQKSADFVRGFSEAEERAAA